MRRAFVSHSTADDSFVAEMESFLRAAGFDDVFNDVHAITPDEKFWPAIEKGIAEADTLVVVITAASNASAWVKREVELARNLTKQIIPVWIEDCPLPMEFADRDVIDFRSRTRAERRFDISRITKYGPDQLIGREADTKRLSESWQKTLRLEKGRPHVLIFVALGGEGKTSLVAKWTAELAAHDWPACDAAFAWSFYSQGTREQLAASSDLFLKEALTFFGDDADKAVAASPAGAFEKGQRLARLLGQRRCLLILDGLEPLQYPPTSPTPGQLKDQGIAALLKGLATAGHGLCVVTSRYSISDLKAFWQTTVREVKLLRLSRGAGVHLLKTLGVKGSERRNLPLNDGVETSEKVNEFEKLVEDVKRHALTLTLLGSYLHEAHNGDIRKRHLVKLEEADDKIEVIPDHPHHAFHVMDAYVDWFATGGKNEDENRKGLRALALLRLLGLFDRPATADCLTALWTGLPIANLTEPLVDLSDLQQNIALRRLEAAKLLTVNRDASGALISLDAHPHLREYFARQLRTQHANAWRAAHRRVYEHLCATTPDKDEPTLEDLQPLYQAVAHGCQAGLQREACVKVYRDRISRGTRDEDYYSIKKLGAFGSDLGAMAYFFERPWSRVSTAITEDLQGWILANAAACLRSLGRLGESIEPIRASVELTERIKDWVNAANTSASLSQIELILGKVADAVRDAEQSIKFAENSGDWNQEMKRRSNYADALHQAGLFGESEKNFRLAEAMQAQHQPSYPTLYSLRGFQYCELLLITPERASWQSVLKLKKHDSIDKTDAVCQTVSRRAAQSLRWVAGRLGIINDGLDHLTLGRSALYEAILRNSGIQKSKSEIEQAVDAVRRGAAQDFVVRGLLARAWLR